jgi:hypothetical protein
MKELQAASRKLQIPTRLELEAWSLKLKAE